jgi:hypothetical protein
MGASATAGLALGVKQQRHGVRIPGKSDFESWPVRIGGRSALGGRWMNQKEKPRAASATKAVADTVHLFNASFVIAMTLGRSSHSAA